jgi:hypothetical protein
MSHSQTPYTLNAEQVEAALSALTKATETFRLSPLEERLYRALELCAKVAGLSFVVIVLLVVLQANGVTAIGDAAIGFPALFFLAALAAATVLLIANFGVVRDALRQQRVLKQLGLEQVAYSALKVQRKPSGLARVGRAALTTLGGISLVLLVLWAFGTDTPDAEEVTAGLSLFLLGVTLLLWRVVQRSREGLAVVSDAGQLRALLLGMTRGNNTEVVVPARVLEKVAGIEKAQIERERNRAVMAGLSAHRGYGVQLSREASEQKASLPPALRLEVEELIEQVVAEPRASGSAQGPGDTLLARTPSGSAEVDYSVDEARSRVQILTLRASLERPLPTSVSHAQ